MTIDAAALIQQVLYNHLKTVELTTALPIAPPGKNFDPKGKAYLRSTLLMADTGGPFLSDTDPTVDSGIFQIDVFWPENKGEAEARKAASALRVHFRRGLRLPFVESEDIWMIRPPSVLNAQQEPGWLQLPVRAYWQVCVPPDA